MGDRKEDSAGNPQGNCRHRLSPPTATGVGLITAVAVCTKPSSSAGIN